MEYYNNYGQKMEFTKDSESLGGIFWINQGMKYTNTTTSYNVESPHLLSKVDFFVGKAAGMLYCKLISPARIAEWWQVDSLKMNRYWVPNTLEEV